VALDVDLSRSELMNRLALRDRWNFADAYLKPALADQLIEMTIPDKPNSRLQRYRLTAKGDALRAAQAGGTEREP
jgi:hypothetical protein